MSETESLPNEQAKTNFTPGPIIISLKDPDRRLSLTPSGEVLATETHQKRIRLLEDSKGDGVADSFVVVVIGMREQVINWFLSLSIAMVAPKDTTKTF